MPRVIRFSEADEAWLHQHHHEHSPRELAQRLGVCVDTMKRMLVRRGLAKFTAAKYVASTKPRLWARPCIGCKSTAPRARNLFFCEACRTRREWD